MSRLWINLAVAALLFVAAAGGLTWALIGTGLTTQQKGVTPVGPAGATVPAEAAKAQGPAVAAAAGGPDVALNIGASDDERRAVIRVLDKITLRTREYELAMDQSVRFGAIDIRVRTCEARPPEEMPESAAFLQIDETRPNGPKRRIFSGWMFASRPAANALEHPIYEVWVASCKMSFPDRGPDTVEVGKAAEDAEPSKEDAASPRPTLAPSAAPAVDAAPTEPAPTDG
jgi:hypothetical protein